MNIEELKSPWRQFVAGNSIDDIDRSQIFWATTQWPSRNIYQTSIYLMKQASIYALILTFCQSC
ncbi:MAG: hypothetical protein ABIS36_21020 [Chryseolinea sp.]